MGVQGPVARVSGFNQPNQLRETAPGTSSVQNTPERGLSSFLASRSFPDATAELERSLRRAAKPTAATLLGAGAKRSTGPRCFSGEARLLERIHHLLTYRFR